tara:strand:- start:4178 stop:5686 length:1509 start_codon:yes stop_codon:yes gene_type:complete
MIKNIFLSKLTWITFLIYNLLIFNSEYFSTYFYILSIGIFFLNVFPIINFCLNHKKINYIPLFYFTHTYFFFCYTIGLFFPEYVVSILTGDILGEIFLDSNLQVKIFQNAMIIYIFGLFFFNLGNFIILHFFQDNFKTNNFFSYKDNNKEILLLGILTYLLSLIFIFITDSEVLKKIYQIKYPLIYMSLICFHLFILFKENLKITYKVILYILVFFILFLEILDGSIAKSFLYLIAIYLVNFIVTKKINLKFLFSIIFVCVLLHTFKYEYRNLIWGISNVNSTLSNYETALKKNQKTHDKIERGKLFISTYYDSVNNIKNEKIKKSLDTFINRNLSRLTHSIQSLIVVVGLSPQYVPYWEGYSYKIFVTKLIPRIFWENKPSDILGNEFGKRYKILNEGDMSTSWNMPVLNEFFVNFGIIGVLIGMFFLGFIFSILPIFLNYKYDNYLFIITFITLYPRFFLESHFSLNFGAVLQTFIFLLVYLYFFKKFLLIMKRFLKLFR